MGGKLLRAVEAMGTVEGHTKVALLGLGIGIPVRALGSDSGEWGTDVTVGLPYLVAINRRHIPSGVGAGIGLTGPHVSFAPGAKELHQVHRIQQEKFKDAEK